MNSAHLVGQPVNAVQELRKEPHLIPLRVITSPLKHSKQDESGSSSQPGPESRRPGLAHGLMYASMILIPSNRRLEDLSRREYANSTRKAYVEYPADMLHRLQAAGSGKDFRGKEPHAALHKAIWIVGLRRVESHIVH